MYACTSLAFSHLKSHLGKGGQICSPEGFCWCCLEISSPRDLQIPEASRNANHAAFQKLYTSQASNELMITLIFLYMYNFFAKLWQKKKCHTLVSTCSYWMLELSIVYLFIKQNSAIVDETLHQEIAMRDAKWCILALSRPPTQLPINISQTTHQGMC